MTVIRKTPTAAQRRRLQLEQREAEALGKAGAAALLELEMRSPSKVSVAGRRPRPMAIDVVEDRLSFIPDVRKRWLLALHIAETCYECFSMERLFRELIDRSPDDLDGILTALVDLDIALRHIAMHWRDLERPLKASIRQVDRAYTKVSKTAGAKRTGRQTSGRR